jgi:hypothetical protein
LRLYALGAPSPRKIWSHTPAATAGSVLDSSVQPHDNAGCL